MNRRQKIVLAVLAALDLIVVVTLGAIVYTQSRRLPAANAFQPAPVSPQSPAIEAWLCASELARAFDDGATPTLGWNDSQLTVQLELAVTAPSDETAQWMWPLLDRLAQAHRAGCDLPPEIVLRLEAHGPDSTLKAIAVLMTTDLRLWAAGDISDSVFAELVRYTSTEALSLTREPVRLGHPR